MFAPLSNAVSFQNTFSYTSRGFLWFSFAPFSSTVIIVNIHPFWVSNAKGISVILCAQVAFLSVRKKSAWISWHFWKQHKALIFLYTWVTYCHLQVNWRLFLCISLVLAWFFFFFRDSVFHYYFWWSGLMCCLLIVYVSFLLDLNVEKGMSCHQRESR